MAKNREYSEIIHISPLNKKILLNEAKEKLVEDNPELAGTRITPNRIMTTLLKKHLGLTFFDIKRKYEHELNIPNTE